MEKTSREVRLAEGEYRFASLVWANEPLHSGELAALSAQSLGWKKSTAYTVLKKLCERGVLKNEGGTVTALIKQDEVRRSVSAEVVEKNFDGSLPSFVAAFLNGRGVSAEDAAEIRTMLDKARGSGEGDE